MERPAPADYWRSHSNRTFSSMAAPAFTLTVSFLARMLLKDTCNAPTEDFLPGGYAGAALSPC